MSKSDHAIYMRQWRKKNINRVKKSHMDSLRRLDTRAFGKPLRNFIYCLKDPITSEPRYIGLSTIGFERIRTHFRASQLKKNIYKNNWIKSVLSSGFRLTVSNWRSVAEIIKEFPDDSNKEEIAGAEVQFIKDYRDRGHSLTNATTGGEGVFGLDETTKKRRVSRIRASLRTPETRKKRKKETINLWKQKDYRKNVIDGVRAYNENCRRKVEDQFGTVYQSAAHAARAIKSRYSDIGRVLSGRRIHSKGYAFRYLGENKSMPEGFVRYWRNRHILCYNNGKKYETLSAAANELNLRATHISRVCRGLLKSTGGYTFKFV